MLTPHPRAVREYWFFKINAGPVALLVDWIARRTLNANVLRVSLRSLPGRAVWLELQSQLFGECNSFGAAYLTGQVQSVAWELNLEPRGEWIAPDIVLAALLGMTGLTLVSALLVRNELADSYLRRAGDRELAISPRPLPQRPDRRKHFRFNSSVSARRRSH